MNQRDMSEWAIRALEMARGGQSILAASYRVAIHSPCTWCEAHDHMTYLVKVVGLSVVDAATLVEGAACRGFV